VKITYTLSPIDEILLRHLRLAQLKTKSPNEIITLFEAHNEFLLAVMKVQRDEGGGRILLGDNTGSGAVILLLSRSCYFLNGSITMCSQRNIILYSVRQHNHFII